jgi:peptidoglycan/xylan/chitin deacetylase (PgdA/CDA1 family)
VLATVDPAVVEGLTSVVDEDLEPGYVYVTLPEIPGAQAWTEALRADLAPQLGRFRRAEADLDVQPLPELHVAWDLVSASPDAIGLRTVTSELGPDRDFDGEVLIRWWDPALGAERPSSDLIDPAAEQEFLTRLDAAAQSDPDVVGQEFSAAESDGLAGLDSIAFTQDGRLFVEFDRHEISQVNTPVGLAVEAEGLLSDFGRAAQSGATSPADPALAPEGMESTPSDPALAPEGMESTPSDPALAPEGMESTPSDPAGPSADAGPAVDCDEVKCAALTFDDGPVSGTNDLLDVLAEKDVDVTFFTVGSNVENHPEILARMVAEGHVVGNHTHDHPQLTRLSTDEISSQIERTNDAIQQATGTRPTLLRPPYGATNATVSAVASDLGMALINWNVDPEDWKDRNSQIVRQRVLTNTRNGSIVLSHDIHETTRDAYADIIDGLRARGFTLVTVPELLGEVEPGKLYYSR